jgi:hypothetical protein
LSRKSSSNNNSDDDSKNDDDDDDNDNNNDSSGSSSSNNNNNSVDSDGDTNNTKHIIQEQLHDQQLEPRDNNRYLTWPYTLSSALGTGSQRQHPIATRDIFCNIQ